MKYLKFLSLLSLSVLTLTSCNENRDVKQQNKVQTKDTFKQKNIAVKAAPNTNQEIALPKNLRPVWGYRFRIKGDFNGDGRKEYLIEHFVSGVDSQETNKFYDSLENYDQLVYLTAKKEPVSFLVSSNKAIDTLQIAANKQLLGLSFLKNEGDLNGDGTDEVSYVINWADWSNMNTWHIVTYKNKEWKELYSFHMWDWQLPDLPQTYNDYGFMGLDNKIVNSTNDSISIQQEKQLKRFPGLVKKFGTNKIRIIYMNNEAMEDTTVVYLNRQPKYQE